MWHDSILVSKVKSLQGSQGGSLIIAVLIPVAALGWLGLGAVVATHEIAEIGVIANGLRARRHLHTEPRADSATIQTPTVAHA